MKESEREKQVRRAWTAWGPYGRWTFCKNCGEDRYCRGKQKRNMLCVTCFGQVMKV